MLDIVTAGTTDYSCTIRIVDSTDGTPETGVVFNTAGIDLWYRRPGAVHTSITEATQTEAGAHTDGGFVHISDGYYRLDLPDAAVASGVDYVDIGGTVTDMVVIGGRIRITGADLDDTVRLGLTALPNAAADAAGGLAISDAGGADLDTLISNVAAILVDTGTSGVAVADGAITAAKLGADCITSAKIADDALTSDQISSTFTNEIWNKIVETNGSRTAQQVLSVVLAAVAGVTSNSGATFSDPSGTNTRITATVNGSNERTAITLAPSS